MIAGINPAADMSQLRNQQQTLAMQSSAASSTTAAATATTAPAADPTVAATSAAGDASMGAVGVQQPPNTTKIILQSVMKGALTGASITMGLKQFGPLLGHIPFIAKLVGTLPEAAAVAAAAGAAGKVGTGLLGLLSKVPLVGALLPKMLGPGLAGFAITALAGAVVGGIVGVFTGMASAKKATAAYNESLAAVQAAQPSGDAKDTPDTAKTPAPGSSKAKGKAQAAPKGKWKSWVVAKHGTHLGNPKATGHYNAKAGDTVAGLAKRFYTTPAEIRKLNPGLTGDTVPAGTKVTLDRKVVPNAKAWVA